MHYAPCVVWYLGYSGLSDKSSAIDILFRVFGSSVYHYIMIIIPLDLQSVKVYLKWKLHGPLMDSGSSPI